MKHSHTLSRNKTGLVIIDMQEKFRPVIPEFETIVQNVVRLTLTFQMFKMPILVTEQYPRGLGNTVPVISSQFPVLETIEKVHFSCMQNQEFRKALAARELTSIVLCGVESHVCINQTALELLNEAFTVHVAADAVGARNPLDHEIALKKMVQAGVVPATTEMILFELVEKAGTESFRNIQRMVKMKLKKSLIDTAPVDRNNEPVQATRTETMTSQEPEQPVSGSEDILTDAVDQAGEIEDTGVSQTPETTEQENGEENIATGEFDLPEDELAIDAPERASAGEEPSLSDIEALVAEDPAGGGAENSGDDELDLGDISDLLGDDDEDKS